MNILHLSNDYSGSTVYKNLCSAEDKLGISQTIYNARKKTIHSNKNTISFKNSSSAIIYSNILNIFTRINFFHKQNKIYNDLCSKVTDIQSIDLIHAHTWFSDGAIAYKLYTEFKIPYIIAIRDTDINMFFKYLLHLRKLGIRILLNAEKIIFISMAHQQRFVKHKAIKKHLNALSNKIEVIPNGIDNFWIENAACRKNKLSSNPQLLFIGIFNKRKNISRLIKAISKLKYEGYDLTLNLVGGEKGKFSKNDNIKNHGIISDKNELKKIINQSDIFTMPSLTETFGLVYIEALSQGIPVLYSKNEGIDGMYDNIGESVFPKSVESIKNGIRLLIEDYDKYNFNPKCILSNHNWDVIAQKYFDIYQTIKS